MRVRNWKRMVDREVMIWRKDQKKNAPHYGPSRLISVGSKYVTIRLLDKERDRVVNDLDYKILIDDIQQLRPA